MVPPDFLSQLEILAFNLYNDYYYEEIRQTIGKERVNELSMQSQKVMAERIERLEKQFKS